MSAPGYTRFRLFSGTDPFALEEEMNTWAGSTVGGKFVRVKRTQLAASPSAMTTVFGAPGEPPMTRVAPFVFILVSYELEHDNIVRSPSPSQPAF